MNFNPATLLWYANLAASAVLLGRLVAQNLWRTYRIFCLYLLTDVIQQLVGIPVRAQSAKAYFVVYIIGQAVKIVLLIFVVSELFQNALKAHPAVGRFARNAAAYVLLASVAIAAVVLWFTPPVTRSGVVTLAYYYVFERTVDSVSLALVLLMSTFILWFPVRLSRNIAWFLAALTAYLCARWMAIFSAGLRPELIRAISNGTLTVSLLCLLVMIRAMAWAGEESTVTPGSRWNPDRMRRLRAKLEAFETYLAGLGKKQRNSAGNTALHSSEL